MMYDVIYADPPWKYSFSKSKSRRIENHYDTMTLKDICALNVPAADNSVLYLWATAPKLLEALKVMDSWGFTYKSQIIWDKEKMGMGYWARGQHEILLIGTKGKFSPPEPKVRKRSVLRVKRNKHSKKPDQVYEYIESWFPEKKKLEMFARIKRIGWDIWGNELVNDIEIQEIK